MGARRRRRRKMERRGGYARGPHQAATAKREVRTETKDPRMEASGSEDFAGVKATARRDAQAREGRMAPLLAQVEHMLDGLDDMDGAEDVPFDELIGMQGLVFHLVENAITKQQLMELWFLETQLLLLLMGMCMRISALRMLWSSDTEKIVQMC
ncbi:unnamed protein product [Triticum turgidum subsp. durum]|uniref:Uncharacterized protein n=1 Tax=Triticum turgidum subsp. durum TaxID=4567 RepID=A0A9R1QNE4_TRITD|nr:unnamed protein product [Triticum turgidum subsp. durum]VAI04098.1 unnamed protein product [Triticum turgidum subsp. durum]